MKHLSKRDRAALRRILLASAALAAVMLLPPVPLPCSLPLLTTAGGSGAVLSAWVLYLIPYLIVGWGVLRRAASKLLRGQLLDEDFLMSIATVGAFATAEYTEAVFVMLFFQLGELFEHYATGKSRASIAALMDLRPDTANLERADGRTEEVDPEDVAVGDVIVVKPGQRIPLDGTVLSGASALDTAALTGESLPRDVAPGDAVISGCVNLSGVLRIRVDRPCGESTVSKILELVESAAERKSSSEAFITRFARYYTPCVVLAAVLLAVIPPLFVGGWGDWFHRALIFLVISCPCALVISVPLSFFGGIGGASRCGILIKGGNDLEALAKTDTVVFDKTGTLTRGVFTVSSIHPAEGFSEAQLLETAAAAEQYSDHPIAQSLRSACATQPAPAGTTEAEELAGYGLCARVGGRRVWVGSRRLMERRGIAVPHDALHGTVVHVAVENRYAGAIVISDLPKASAGEAIAALKRLGVRRTIMLTGDTEAAAQAVAAEVGIDETHAGLLPADKVAQVERLLEETPGTLVFVGDGVNDAPVLTRADVGIAMGGLGSDAAIEAADVVLMDDDPAKLSSAIRLSRKTMGIVRQNIVFSLGVKFGVMALGALGYASMPLAIFADVGVAFLAILNAMRCLQAEKSPLPERR